MSLDWALMALFYSALHYIEAFLAQSNIHCSNHTFRERQILNLMPDLYEPYNDLKNDSMEARYQMRIFSADEIRNNMVPNLQVIKKYVLED